VHVIPLGVGDAFSLLYYSTCLLVEAEGTRLLIDCPHPVRKILAENAPGIDLDSIDAVVLTHLHADHCSGLEPLGFFSHFVLGRPARMLSHPAVQARTWERLAPGMDQLWRPEKGAMEAMRFEDYFTHTPLSVDAPVTFGPFTIEARMTHHHVPTTALRLSAGGRTLAYSADTGFDRGLIDWLEDGADLIIHETNLGAHTHHHELEALPQHIRERMRLIHYPDFYDTDKAVIPCVREGERLTVG